MVKDNDDLGGSRVGESSRSDSVLVVDAGETLDENLGCDGGEIMVEVVGSDVFVDGVGGDDMGGNRDLGVGGWEEEIARGDGDGDGDDYDQVGQGGVEIGIDRLEEMAGSLGDKDLVNEDVAVEEVDVVAREVGGNEGDLERGEELIEKDDASMLDGTDVREDSDKHGDAMICDTNVVEEDVKVVVNEESKSFEVIKRDGVSCILTAPSASEDTYVNANRCDTRVEVDMKVVVNKDSENCEKVTGRDGVSTLPVRQDTDMLEDAEGVKEHEKVLTSEDALGRDENVIERDDVSCEMATQSAHEDSGMPGDFNAGVGAGDTLVMTGSFAGNTVIDSEKLASNENGAGESVKSVGEVIENQITPEIGVSGDEASEAHVLNDLGSSKISVETAKRPEVSDGDGNINEGTDSSRDLLSTIGNSETVVSGSTEAIDNKVLNADQDVISGDHKILTTGSEDMLIESTDYAGHNELKVKAFSGSSRNDISLCSDLDSGSKHILADSKLILNDSLLSNPQVEVLVAKVDRPDITCPDKGKDVEQVTIPETDVSMLNIKEAVDSKDNGSVDVVSNRNSSSYVEGGTVGNSSEIDVALGPYPVCRSKEIHDTADANEVSGKGANINLGVPTNVMDVNLGSEVQDVKFDPSEKDGPVPMNEENPEKQAVDFEIVVEAMEVEKPLAPELNVSIDKQSFLREDQQTGAVTSAVSDVLKGQGDMKTLAEDMVVAGADTTVDEVKLSDSKTVLEGDTRQAENINFNSVIASEISPMDEENEDKLQKSDLIQSGTLICNDDPDNVFNHLPTKMLDKGDMIKTVAQTGEVASGTQPAPSSDMLHGMGEAVHCVTDIHSHFPDDNQSSDVVVPLPPQEDTKGLYVSKGVTPDEDVDLAEDVNLAGESEEEKKSQGEDLEEDISLPYDSEYIDSNLQVTEGDFDLQIPECLDASSTDNFVGLSSVQESELQDKTMEFDQSEDFDEKLSEQMSPGSGGLYSNCHSRYLLPPKTEGEFSASDLIWGKVRSHPWWPGQICNPADASENAMKYHKKDCFLVSYFGDGTFAWNDSSLLRPFRTHFPQIKKQSNNEAFHHAVSCALEEVSRRVELGLACSCIPKNSFAKFESQIVENAGIRAEAGRRYGVDDSTSASCFEPEELLEHIRSLALFPSAGIDNLLQLVISKAQLSAFSSFKGHNPLPEFQSCGGFLENDANADIVQQHSEQIIGENSFSGKRNHDFVESLLPRKKERSMSDLIDDKSHSSNGEDELDSNFSSASRKRKAHDPLADDGSDKRQSYYAAKVSTAASQAPKPSFKIGECIRRAASQLTGTPPLVKSNSEKFLKIDDSVEQQPGYDDFMQTPVNSQRERMILSPEHSSVDEMLSQLYLAAQDPMKGYSFLNNITSFFSDFRQSIAVVQNSKVRNLSTGRGRKKKTPNSVMTSPEDFEFDDVNDSYWTDRIVQNYGEDQLLNNAQNGETEYQLVLHEADRPLKSSRKSRKQFSTGEHLVVAEEPIADHIDSNQDCLPAELILNFASGHTVPTELNLNKIFRRFGTLRECETEVDRETRRARVVFKRSSDAKIALNSAGKFNIFGPMDVTYELNYVPSAPYKPLPVTALEGELN